ncbi:MAG: hypothetical protein ACRD1S_08560 [Vicinamibacterales bacterium]
MKPDDLSPLGVSESLRAAIEHAITQALPDGWTMSRGTEHMRFMGIVDLTDSATEWTIASTQYNLGHYDLRLTGDRQQLIFVHSTDIHCFPPPIEEATLIRLDAFTQSTLSSLLRQLIANRRPILVHPT